MSEQMEFPKTWEEYEKDYGFNDSEGIYTNNSRLIPSFRVKQWLDHLGQEPKYCDRNICIKNEYNGIGCEKCEVTKSQEPKFIAKSDGTIEQIKNCDDCLFKKEWEKIGKLLSVVLKKQTEQEPCEDCISRAEAIKALEYNLSVEADGGLDKYRTVIKDLLNAIYNTQKKAIEDLPSIQPTAKENLVVEDCISRAEVMKLSQHKPEYGDMIYAFDVSILPSVQPKPKIGHWIMSDDGLYRPICNNCGAHPWKGYIPTVEEATEVFKYCPNCGAKMESEDKE